MTTKDQQQRIWDVHKQWANQGSRRRKMTDRMTVTATDHALHASALGEDENDVEALHKMMDDAGVPVRTRAPKPKREQQQ